MSAVLGVVTALTLEAAAFARPVPHLRVVSCGVGAGCATEAAKTLVADGVSGLISLGYAGSLRDTLKAGDLLLPEWVWEPDGKRHDVDAKLHARLKQLLGSLVHSARGAIVCSPAAVESPAQKESLGEVSGGLAVDMESAEVAAVAVGAGLPFAVLRVVLDEYRDRLPEILARTTTLSGGTDFVALASGMLRRPQDIGALIALAGRQRNAQRTLVTVAERLERFVSGT